MNLYLVLGALMQVCGVLCWGFVGKCLYTIFRTQLVVDLAVNELFKTFSLKEKGSFAIWEEGPMLKKSAMVFCTPQIIHTENQQAVKLSRSYGNATKNSFTRASRLIYFCELDAGHYILEVRAGSSLGKVDQLINSAIDQVANISTVPLSQYRIQLRKSLTKRQRLLMIPAVFVGLFLFNIGLFTVLHYAFGVQIEGALGA